MDTTKLGAISGTIGAVASIIPGLLTRNLFKIAKLNFLDYASVLTLGHKVNDIWHWIIAVIGHLIFGAVLGVIFAYFIKKTSDESLILKGCGFGAAVWLVTLGLGSFFKLPHFKMTAPSDCFFILIDAVCYGVVLAFSYQHISNKNSRRFS
jgi:ABC-type xylose transport system permease subunit